MLALWGDASDVSRRTGASAKSACKLVREWGSVERILENADRIKGKQGERIAGVGRPAAAGQAAHDDPARRSDRVPGEGSRSANPASMRCGRSLPNSTSKAFLNDLANLAPAEPCSDAPVREAQTQLAEVARAKSAAAGRRPSRARTTCSPDRVAEDPPQRQSPRRRGEEPKPLRTAHHGAPPAIRSSKARSSCARR